MVFVSLERLEWDYSIVSLEKLVQEYSVINISTSLLGTGHRQVVWPKQNKFLCWAFFYTYSFTFSISYFQSHLQSLILSALLSFCVRKFLEKVNFLNLTQMLSTIQVLRLEKTCFSFFKVEKALNSHDSTRSSWQPLPSHCFVILGLC